MTDDTNTSALERLLQAMGNDQGFPALSSTISEINKIVASESESAGKLTKTILQDFALTNKLLRLVNTVSYGQFGGKINTISKAVVILGFETVRNVATALILLEFLQNKTQAVSLRDEILSSFFAGLVAVQLAKGRNIRDTEEVMICAMFHKLGKLLAKFYFFEESLEVDQLMEQGMGETQASQKVFGISYNDLGIAIAKGWNFPERLQSGMQKLTGEKIRKPRDELDYLHVTTNLANELCELAARTSNEQKDLALDKLIERYHEAATLSKQQLNKALDHGLEEISVRSGILDLPTAGSSLLKTVAQWSRHEVVEEPEENEHGLNGYTVIDQVAELSNETEITRAEPETILGAGIQDVTNTLVSEYNLNDVLQMVLETMYRGMQFHHILAFVRDSKSNTMRARFGFGEGIDALLTKLEFPLPFQPDVFHVALEKGVDIVIEDVAAENIASKIPAWYHDVVKAECFLLLPIMVNGKAIGLIYADMPHANTLQVTPRQLNLLRTLRNQAIIAIKQKQ